MGKYFGTDGVRGIANKSLTAVMAYRIGRFLGQYPNHHKNKILLCRDTRLSGDVLLHSVIAGVLASGSDVYDEGVSTTPSISFLVEKEHFDFGVMISASHNPFIDNGIKVFNNEGEKLDDAIESLIEAYMDKPEDDLPLPEGDQVGRYHDGENLKKEYIAWLAKKATARFDGLRVLVDCANGSATFVAPELYRLIGLDATFIHSAPDGTNINRECGSTNLASLKKAFAEGRYDLAFAFDGDSDRFMALAPNGRVIDGDALIFLNALSMQKKKMLHDDCVVLTVMSNFGLKKALNQHGISCEIVAVGDKNVQQKLKEKRLDLGGEQSGHVIFLDDLNTGDGLLSSVKLLNIFVKEKAVFASLSDFVVYPQILLNVRFTDKEKLQEVSKSPKLEMFVGQQEKLLNGEGRVLVRGSGTEPLLRIMVEHPSKELCESVAKAIVAYAEEEAKE
jgi:phosphoglucosamine mutase